MVLSSRASIPPMRHGKRRAASQATQTAGEMQREGETVAGAEIQSGVPRGHEAQQKLSTESSHPCPFVGGGKAELALVQPSSRAIPELIAGSEGPSAHPLFAQPVPSPWTGWKMWKSGVVLGHPAFGCVLKKPLQICCCFFGTYPRSDHSSGTSGTEDLWVRLVQDHSGSGCTSCCLCSPGDQSEMPGPRRRL